MDFKVTGDLTAARSVRNAFYDPSIRVFGVFNTMPEATCVGGIAAQLDRILIITMTVAIDYQRDAESLWRLARNLYDDADTRWAFCPSEVMKHTDQEITQTLQSKGSLRYPSNDVSWWRKNAAIWNDRYDGNPLNLFEKCQWDVNQIVHNVKKTDRFLGLKGRKILPLWLRMLRDIEGLPFRGLAHLDMPVDVHIARATFTVGLAKGKFSGSLSSLIPFIQQAWRDSTPDSDNRIALDYDESLWNLSREGCHYRHSSGNTDCPKRSACVIGGSCPKGVISVSTDRVVVDT